VLRDKCIGCGTCVALAGNTFKMDDEGKAIVSDPQGDDSDTISMAKDSCPTQAIVLE
jgi:ferredoxin